MSHSTWLVRELTGDITEAFLAWVDLVEHGDLLVLLVAEQVETDAGEGQDHILVRVVGHGKVESDAAHAGDLGPGGDHEDEGRFASVLHPAAIDKVVEVESLAFLVSLLLQLGQLEHLVGDLLVVEGTLDCLVWHA